MTHLVISSLYDTACNGFYNTMQLTYVLGNYYDLYKYHEVCTNQLIEKDHSMIETGCLKNDVIII